MDEVVIRDVSPRDGLQSVSRVVPVEDRIRLVRELAAAGVRRVEAGSCVSERAVPQMAGTPEVLAGAEGIEASREVLVVNAKGAQRALDADADALVMVVAASDEFSRRNVRMSVDDALAQAKEVVTLASACGTPVHADVATSFGCAYTGPVATEAVARVVEALLGMGVDEIVLCDTTGMASPKLVTERVAAARSAGALPGLHLHDTRGLGLANVCAGLDAGVRSFDASAGGVGGCPFSPGATGNIATEDAVHLFELQGLQTGIDLDALCGTARWLEEVVAEALPGRVMRAGPVWAPIGRSSR